MTSTIYLYKNAKIVPAKNFVVEDLETYLAGLTKITFTDFQYLRNDLSLSIKINVSQIYTDSNSLYNYNYLKVSQNSINYYYFILKKTQVAESTIVLDLAMDTLNTYPWGTAFTPSNRTKVNREHKDRFSLVSNNASIDLSSKITAGSFSMGTIYNVEVRLFIGGTLAKNFYCKGERKTGSFELYEIDSEDLEYIKDNQETSFNNVVFKTTSPSQSFTITSATLGAEFIITKDLKRIIDYYSEGITPVLYKTELGELTESNPFQWSLVYRNPDNDINAVGCYCIPSEEVSLYIPSKTNFLYTDFEDGKYYLIGAFWNNWTWRQSANGYIIIDGEKVSHSVFSPGSVATFDTIIIHRVGSNLSYAKYRFITNLPLIGGGLPSITSRSVLSSFKTFTTMTLDSNKLVAKVNSIPNVDGSYPYWNDSFVLADQTYTLTSFPNIDRVDSKLIKIIKLPYFPASYTYENGNFSVDETFVYESSVYKSLQLNNLDTKFLNTITSEISNPLNIFDVSLSISTSDLRNDNNESKLFHSDYYQPKFVYDSFGFVFELEKIDLDKFKPSANFTFEFVMTSTINSKFMFKFPEYILKLSTSDYDNILPVARNNEAPIYNSAYITYLRTAYRYDLKQYYQKEGIIKFNASMGVANALTTMTEGGIRKDVSQVISGLGNYASSLFNAITQQNQNEWNLQSKLDLLRAQANSVSGSDDLDLMENYANNKAKLCLYKVSDRIKDLLADLFYYYGYTTQEIKIPSLNTRYWFNFISCELEFTGLDKNISELCKEDLINKYNNGATFLHNHSGEWDFDQEKENWESWLI